MPRGGRRFPPGGRPNRTGINWQQPIADARRQLRRSRGMQPQAHPVMINGVTYPSQAAASRALGVTERRIRTWVAEHGAAFTIDDIASYRPRRRSVAPTPADGRIRPVEIDGVRYESMAQAARALGVTRQAVSLRVRKRENNA